MPTIEIATTQNVTIEYELAHWRERFLAFLLDSILCGVIVLLLVWFGQLLFGESGMGYYASLVCAPVLVFYSLYMESLLEGQTPGKKALGIRVVKLNGSLPTFSEYALRWAMRLIEIWLTFGALASLLISSSPNSQRLGDLLAGTTVIRLNPTRTFSLKDILNIHTLENYQPQFPEVVRFSEKDMLFIKNALERFRNYPNDAHDQAVAALARHMATQLGLEKVPGEKTNFLRTLLNDYIVLTR